MKAKLLLGAVTAALLLVFATPQAGAAQDKKSLEERVAELEKKVGVLEEYIAKLEAEKKLSDVEELLGSLRDEAGMRYARAGSYPRDLVAACGVKIDDLSTDTHTVRDEVFFVLEDLWKRDRIAALIADPKEEGGKYAVLTFSWETGKGDLNWYESEADLKDDNPNIKFSDKTVAEPDPFLLYKKKGRKWKHKSVVKIEGMDDMVSYMVYEVTKVAEDYSVYTMTLHDKNDKPMEGMNPIETHVDKIRATDPYVEPVDVDLVEETIKVKAGEFTCFRFEQHGTKTWTSKKYPGLLVKMEGASNSMELIEFTE